MVRSTRILHTQGGVELLGGLPFANCCHVHTDQLGDLGGDACSSTMTHLLIVADVKICRLGWFQTSIMQSLNCSHQACHTGFIIQVTRAHKSVGELHAWVKGDEITHSYTQCLSTLLGGGTGIQAYLHIIILALGLIYFSAMDVTGSHFKHDCT